MPLIDFAVVTALPEEFLALKKLHNAEVVGDDSSIWFRSTIASNSPERQYQVLFACATQMGVMPMTSLVTEIISDWQPAAIILIGIAGSFHSSVRLGDIIVSQQIFYYDQGKILDVAPKDKKRLKKRPSEQITSTNIAYRPQGYPSSAKLIKLTEALSFQEGKWQKSASQSAKRKAAVLSKKSPGKFLTVIKDLEAHKPNVHFGTIASGSLVMTSEKKKKELLALHGKIIGIEMEGAGLMHAAYYADPLVPAILIKGISDGADSKKANNDKLGYWRELAKENSSKFALELIRSGWMRCLNTDLFDLDSTASDPTSARIHLRSSPTPGMSSLFAFAQLIKPRGPLTGFSLELTIQGDGKTNIHEMLMHFYDQDGKSEEVRIMGNKVEIKSKIAPLPVSLYLLVNGSKTRTINITAKTFALQQTSTYTIPV